jgi:hypothetical protein
VIVEKEGLRGSQLNFVAAFRNWELQNPEDASNFRQELSEEAVAEFAKGTQRGTGQIRGKSEKWFAARMPGTVRYVAAANRSGMK